MKLTHYTDEHGIKHYFDASRVLFTMTQPLGHPNEDGVFTTFGCKVALDANMGFIIADEDPEDVVERIKDVLEIAD